MAGVVHASTTTLDDQFLEFDRAHPEVLEELIRLTRQLVRKGHRRLGMKMLWEVLRWQTMLGAKPGPEQYKLNNNYTSRYARLVMLLCPDLAGIFDMRELKS